ncbi:MAG TPA: glycerophosphodiester phosphodiesterase [Acidimicrobiales bacterium]|nr:glycerophosphodiester phosphodiesterase [Acidimicrobiales bacterium]
MDANPWLDRRVISYAHQGGEKEAPSSTLFAMERALELGMTGIELDVHATRDGVLVVGHDPTIDRTTNRSGDISSLSIDELRDLDNAYWFVPELGTPHDRPPSEYVHRGRFATDSRFGVATLVDVLERFPGVVLNLDIKQTAPEVKPYEEALARLLMEYQRTDDVVVASFFDAATERFSKLAPLIPTSPGQSEITRFVQSIVAGSPPEDEISRHAAIQIPPRFRGFELVTADLVNAAHALGLAVHVWTVDDPSEMEWLCGLGVDGIMTDRPSVLDSVLSRLGIAWQPLKD